MVFGKRAKKMKKCPQIRKKGSFKRTLRREWPLHVMLLPAVILLLIYRHIPMAGIVIAFQKYNPVLGFTKSPFIGLENFRSLFATPGFMGALRNTIVIALAKMICGIIVPLTFSLLLNEVRHMGVKRSIQSIIYLPHFISWVLMAGIIIKILNPVDGLLNSFLGYFGIDPIFFLGDNRYFKPVIIITDIWKTFGYNTIIYMAALTGINPTLYEATEMDGAGRWKQTIHVTLPALIPIVILLATLSLGNILNAGFDQVYNLLSPITMESGDILDTLIYRLGIQGGQFGIATAAGLFKSVISSIFLIVSYKLAYKLAGYRIF